MKSFAVLVGLALCCSRENAVSTAVGGQSTTAQPYPYVMTGSFSGPAVTASPGRREMSSLKPVKAAHLRAELVMEK
jgi:hypothetical protein